MSKKTCEWDFDASLSQPMEGIHYHTACGNLAGSPKTDVLNQAEPFVYCPYCGGKIVEPDNQEEA